MFRSADTVARKIDDRINSYDYKAKNYNDSIMNSKSFWKSENGDLYRGKYGVALWKLYLLSRKYNYIESTATRLSNKIRKAIDERRRQAYLKSLAATTKESK